MRWSVAAKKVLWPEREPAEEESEGEGEEDEVCSLLASRNAWQGGSMPLQFNYPMNISDE